MQLFVSLKMKILFFITLLTLVYCEKFRFDNYTLFRVTPQNEEQIKLLKNLQSSQTNLDFWTDPVPSAEYVTVMSSPNEKNALESYLNQNGINYQITIKNIQEAIEKEKIGQYTRNSRNMGWEPYYPLNDIESWMSDMAAAYPDVTTEITGGMSYQGRPIKGLKISHGEGKRVIFVEAGIHAREWISPSMACYIINELLTSQDEETKAAARHFEWYIFPVTNPDGYIWTHVEFRLWRKNRRPVGTEFGIDLNRNWDSNWMVIGASDNPASDTYAGSAPFSETESRTLANYITFVSERMDLYISFHSSGQLLLIPYGNTTEPLANYYDAINIGRRAMGALSVRYGTPYTTGNIAEAIYHAAGSSMDWVKDHLNVPLVYCYELRDRGTYGHLLPTDQILPNNLEVMDSLLEVIHQARRFGYLNNGNVLHVSGVFIMMIVYLNYLLS